METKNKPADPVRIVMTSRDRIEIGNITKNDAEMLEGMTMGMFWVSVENGRIIFHPKTKPLPEPTPDESMIPFWREHLFPRDGHLQMEIWDPETLRGDFISPTIYIEHVCGYNYTPENYKVEVEKLERWGFEALRSRRGTDGRYWETWMLHLWGAKCELKDAVELEFKVEKGEFIFSEDRKIPVGHAKKLTDSEKLKRAVEFLRTNASFGSLDVSVQRLAMVMDD